ncbi:hypothetical protein KEM48_001759 [Puccinia striiformis f. sp. tritici PST-130]|nr:hypothetical protein KEM48_001759 [Puccinia striiformis f. sp. tritici PST-130]
MLLCVGFDIINIRSNHNSPKALARLKLRHREAFTDLGLFYQTLKILMTRRYVMELFGDVKLDTTTIRKIHKAGESMKISRLDTSRTIPNDPSSSKLNGEGVTTRYEA